MHIDDALKQASDEATKSVALAVPGEPPGGPGRRSGHTDEDVSLLRRSVPVLALAAIVVIGAVGAVVIARNGDTEQAADLVTEADPATDDGTDQAADPQAAGAPTTRFVTDGAPDGLVITHAGAEADLVNPIGTTVHQVYGASGATPEPTQARFSVSFADGVARPPTLPQGIDVDLDGRPGRLIEDGREVAFESGPYLVRVGGRNLTSDELVALAASVELDDDGRPMPLDATAHGLDHLDTLTRTYYEETDGGVLPGSEVTIYRQGLARYLDLHSRPGDATTVDLYQWAVLDPATTEIVGGREILVLAEHDDFGAPFSFLVWEEGGTVVELVAFGVTADEVRGAVAGARRADGDDPADVAAPADDDAGGAATDGAEASDGAAGPEATGAYVAGDLPDGLVLSSAQDHPDLGEPDWLTRQYLYGPPDIDAPGADDPVLALSIGPASAGLLIGERIEIGGIDAVIVDKAAANTNVDVELAFGNRTVHLAGLANVGIDEVLTIAEEYVATALALSGDVGAPATLRSDLVQRHTAADGVWTDADLNGDPAGSSAVYGDRDGSGPLLQVSTLTGGALAIEWMNWRYPGQVNVVDLAAAVGLLVEPVDGILVLRSTAPDGQPVELRSFGLTEAELIAAAASLEPAGG